MFQYEYEKRPGSSSSRSSPQWGQGSRASPQWGQPRADPSVARRPLPPRPIVCERMPTKTSVPLKVWVIASASCFAVCAALVLATVVITKWGSEYSTQLLEEPEPVYSHPHPVYIAPKPAHKAEPKKDDFDNDLEYLEKLKIFKNVVATRGPVKKTQDLTSKPQIHPLDDDIVHEERKIEKKDKAHIPDTVHIDKVMDIVEPENIVVDLNKDVPEFKPTLPDVLRHGDIKLPDGYMLGLRQNTDYEEYYSDENLYDDYMQSNSMTNYLIEKVQELHDWINADPDFESVKNSSRIVPKGTEFTEVLQALNQSLLMGDASIVMNKLKDIYFGDNYTVGVHGRKMILSNSTDLLSFGILTLDIMLLHNIQLMAWEIQESSRTKMLSDPDVFAFNALFMDPGKVETTQNEINHHETAFSKRQNLRQDIDAFDIGKSLLENVLDVGMSAARAAIHLGRAYKNTKAILTQLSNRDPNVSQSQPQLSRDVDGNRHALGRLQASFGRNGTLYTDLDCMWLLYCRNLAATAKLSAPYGVMARINGVALRMLTGEMTADRAIETILYEAMSGWTELKCNDMFPRCSKVNAAAIVLETILQPFKKSQTKNSTEF